MKILIIRLSAIGDTIHSLPVAAAIKRRVAGAEITWLVEPAGAPLLVHNPVVDQVLVLDKKSWTASLWQPWQWQRTFTGIGALVTNLKREKFDLVIDLQGLLKSAVWGAVAGSTIYVGFAHAREGAGRFYTDRVDVGDYFGPDRHIVDLNLSMVDYLCRKLGITGGGEDKPLPPVQFPLPPAPDQSVKKIEMLLGLTSPVPGDHNVSMVRHAVLIPGTTWTSKIWPKESWAKLGQLLASKMGFRLCLVGGGSEASTNAEIRARLNELAPEAQVLDLTGQTNLLDLLALFERSELVVGGDTGPLHLAAAVGKPCVVGVYGSTPVRRNGPYGPRCLSINLDLWCQPCFEKVCPLSTTACLTDLSAETVFAGIEQFLI